MIKQIANTGVAGIEMIVRESALPAALLSTMHSGSYAGRAFGGLYSTYNTVAGAFGGYIQNSGIRDTLNGVGSEIISGIGSVATNLQNDSESVLYGAIITFAGCRIVPAASRYVRHNMGKPKTKKVINDTG